MAQAKGNTSKSDKRVDITTPVGILSFPRIFKETAGQKDDGTPSYDIQILIPKTEREGLRALMSAIKEVGEAKWGDRWKSVRHPLRDGDKEADELTDDGQTTKGEKYPERAGHYFLNARSTKPVGVVGRDLTPINDPAAVYGGCKGKVSITLYPYSTQGNFGIAAGLNGVQFVADGEPFGGGRPSVESMFEILEDEGDDDLLGGDDDGDDLLGGDDVEPEPEPAPAPPAKKAAAKRATKKAAPAPVADDEDDLLDDLA